MRRPTSWDVARAAGVSQSTVSRALRGVGRLSPQTRQRVREAADRIGYVAIETGRTLATRSTGRIGIVAGDLRNPFFPELVQPMHDLLRESGYRTVLIPDDEPAAGRAEVFLDGSVDGAILTTERLDSTLPALLSARGLPHVLVNRIVEPGTADSCQVDNRTGAYELGRLVAQAGHRRVGLILGPAATSTARDRETGFRAGLSAGGVDVTDDLVWRGEFDLATGSTGLVGLRRRAPDLQAVLCGNDVIAVGAAGAADAAWPIALAGFDNIAMAAWPEFDLTTAGCPLADLAATAVDLLLTRIAAPHQPSRAVTLPSRLWVRGSHRPPAGLGQQVSRRSSRRRSGSPHR